MSRPAAILSPGTRIGAAFEVVEVVGLGGMGVVYKVREQVGAVSRIRALKTILPQHADDPNIVGRFRQEAEKMCLLEHENIVPVLSYSEEGQFPYLVMPFVEGRTLKEYLGGHVAEHGRALPLAEVMEIGLEIARGLEVAHNFVDPATGRPAPMIHRDIKPGNVMVRVEQSGDERRLKILIMDFGIAKVLSEEDSGQSLTGVIGTVRYASPEQVRRGKDVDPRADIYSLGMLLYELFTGRHMFAELTEYAVLLRMMQKEVEPFEPPYPEGTPESFRELIRRSVAPDRTDRYASVAEMRAVMRRILDDDSGRRSVETQRTEDAARAARGAALERDAPNLASEAFADAEQILLRAEDAYEEGQRTRLYRAALLAFEEAADQAARERDRRRVADGLEALQPLREAAERAEAPTLVPDDVESAERATRNTEQALADDEITLAVRSLGEAGRLWRQAETSARREARRRQSAEMVARLRARLQDESAGFDDLPTLFCPTDGIAGLARARSALEAAAAAVDDGDFSRVAAEAETGERALEEAVRARAGAAEGLAREIAAAERRCAARLEALETGEAAELAAGELAEARSLREEAVAIEGGGRALDAWRETEAAIDRVERTTRDRAAAREAAQREEERQAREAEERARAERETAERARREAEERARKMREAAERARRETPDASDEPRVTRLLEEAMRSWDAGEKALSKESWDAAESALRRAAESWREARRIEDEVLSARIERLVGRARSALAAIDALGADAADPATARFREQIDHAAGIAGRGEQKPVLTRLEELVPSLEKHAGTARERVERQRARQRAETARQRAEASLEGARKFGDHATTDEAFAVAARRFQEGSQHFETESFEAAERSFAGAALAFDDIARRAEEAARAARLAALREHRNALVVALAIEASGFGLRRRRRRALADLTRAERALDRGDEAGARKLLEGCEATARLLRETAPATTRVIGADARPAPSRRVLPIAAGVGGAAVIAVAVVLWPRAPREEIAQSPEPAATVAPPAPQREAAVVVTPPAPPLTAPREEPTATDLAVAKPPVAAAPPTVAPAVPTVALAQPTAPPKPTEAPAIVLARADPSSNEVRLARRASRTFEATVRGVSADQLVWELDGRRAGTGSRFTLGVAESQKPGQRRLALVALRGEERRVLRSWEIAIESEPLRFASLEPADTALEREIGSDVRFRAPVRLDASEKVSFSWEVNDKPARGANGPEYRFPAEEPGRYRVRVRAAAPWGATADNVWDLVVRRPAVPTPAPPPAADPREQLRAWIQSYCRAFERRDTDELMALGHLSSRAEAERLRSALEPMRDLRLECTNPSIDVRGSQATISFDRKDRWTDPRGQRLERELPRITKNLQLRDGRWVAQ